MRTRTVSYVSVAVHLLTSRAGVLSAILIAATWPAYGQAPVYEFTVHDVPNAPEEGRYFQSVDLTVMNDHTVSGWSLSVCHDSSVVDICGAQSTQFVCNLVPIGPLFFNAVSIDDRSTLVPGSTDGANQGVVVDQGWFGFPNNTTGPVLELEYLADPGLAGTTMTTAVCGTVGSPNVAAEVICCGGMSVPLGAGTTANDGTVSFVANQPQWSLGGYDVMTSCAGSPCTVFVPIDIANTVHNVSNTETAGFSLAVQHDAAALFPVAVHLGATVANLQQVGTGTMGPDMVITSITPSGVSIEVQNTAFPAVPVLPYHLQAIDWGSGDTAVEIEYEVLPTAVGSTTQLNFTTVNGIDNTVFVECLRGFQLLPLGGNNLELAPILVGLADNFVRGDCSDSGSVNVADAIFLLSYLFPPTGGGAMPPCFDACDANDDGGLSIADVITVLNALFGSPAAPLPEPNTCGTDPTPEALTCVSHTGC